jgi:hypothetical protein
MLSEGWKMTSANFSGPFRRVCESPENRGIVEHLGFITDTFSQLQRNGHGYADTDCGKTLVLETPFDAVAAALVHFHTHAQLFDYTPEEHARVFVKAKGLFQVVFAGIVFASQPNADDLAARSCQQLLEECKHAYHLRGGNAHAANLLTSFMLGYDEKVCLLEAMELAVERKHWSAQHMPMLSNLIVETPESAVEKQHKDPFNCAKRTHVISKPEVAVD